jgi:5-methyltetrahydropteroyltriglutamate--homocysteine methyltransferase
MAVLIDDIGSFPLPQAVSQEAFSRAYVAARDAFAKGADPRSDEFVKANFCDVVLDSFRKKLNAGLDVVNFPQHYDGVKQIGDVLHKAMDNGTFVVNEKDAFLPEVRLISQEAKSLSEEFGKQILLRISLFGPMEMYLKEIGTTPYPDVLDGFSQTLRLFAKNSILDTKYLKTEVVCIDEPSFGFLNINAANDLIQQTLEKAFDFTGATRQIHLHSSVRLPDLLQINNLDVLTFEYAASPKNIEGVNKRMLEAADKRVRVGVARTDIDTILAELHDQGIANPSAEQLVESKEAIHKRYLFAKEKFGDQMTFTGPDCGLGGWPSQDAAQMLLARVVEAVKNQ